MERDSNWQTRPSLIARLRAGDDQSAWSEFVAIYAPLFLAWCRKWNVAPQDREDVVQDVYLKLTGAIKNYDSAKGRFRAWLKAVAANEWRDFVARRSRAVPIADSQAIETALSDRARDEWLELFERSIRQELIAEAMCRVQLRVQPQSWTTFCLLMQEGMSPDEVCAKLGMTRGQVDMVKYRIKNMLAQEVRRLMGDE